MHFLIKKVMEKRGIKSVKELSKDEQKTFDKWQATLTEGDVTVEKIQVFCENQIKLIESKLRDLDNSLEKNNKLVLQFNIYKALLNAITGPASEKASLEKYLKGLLE